MYVYVHRFHVYRLYGLYIIFIYKTINIIFDPFKSKLQTLMALYSKYFGIYLLKNKYVFLHKLKAMITPKKIFNLD